MSLEVGSYADFSSGFHGRMSGKRIPVNVTIEVSRRCPLNCSHCYNNLPMGDLETARKELTLEEHKHLLDDLEEMGCFWLLFSGGEIFARRDFLEIYTYAKKKGFIITLFTNATLISEKIADYLMEWPPFNIEITLYGRTKETYERLTRVPGSYERCLRGIQLLKERKLPLLIKTVAVSVNCHEVWDMKRFVEEDLGLPFKFDAMMNARIDCSLSPLEVRLTPEEIVDLDLRDPGRVKEWNRFSAQSTRPPRPSGQEDDLYVCGGGVNSFAIDPLGKMSICVLSHQDEYDIRQGSVREGWDHFIATARRKKVTRVTKCTACQITSVCGMCPATAELETGDPESPIDFLCHTAHLRAQTMGWTVPAHGDCEYCDGGIGHARLLLEKERILAGSTPPARPNVTLLPVATRMNGTLPSAAGCGGCGSH